MTILAKCQQVRDFCQWACNTS